MKAYIDISEAMRLIRDVIGLTVHDLATAFKTATLRTGASYALVVNPVESRGIKIEGVGDQALKVGYELAELVRDFIARREKGDLPDLEKELTAFAFKHAVIIVNVSERDEAYLVIVPSSRETQMKREESTA